MNDLTKQDWDRLDDAHDRMQTRMIDWCVLLSEMDHADESGETQEQVGDRYGIDHSNICMMITVGYNADKFFLPGKKLIPNLPNGYSQLYQLTKLNKTEIKGLCKNGVPSRSMIIERRYELGIDERPARKLKGGKAIAGIDWGLVPATELHGLSEVGVKMLQKEEKKLVPVLEQLNQKLSREVLTDMVKLARYNQRVVQAMAASLAKQELKEREADLDARERRLVERERVMVHGINEADKKLIQGILHPDKAPAGMQARYAKAFDAFRKVAA